MTPTDEFRKLRRRTVRNHVLFWVLLPVGILLALQLLAVADVGDENAQIGFVWTAVYVIFALPVVVLAGAFEISLLFFLDRAKKMSPGQRAAVPVVVFGLFMVPSLLPPWHLMNLRPVFAGMVILGAMYLFNLRYWKRVSEIQVAEHVAAGGDPAQPVAPLTTSDQLRRRTVRNHAIGYGVLLVCVAALSQILKNPSVRTSLFGDIDNDIYRVFSALPNIVLMAGVVEIVLLLLLSRTKRLKPILWAAISVVPGIVFLLLWLADRYGDERQIFIAPFIVLLLVGLYVFNRRYWSRLAQVRAAEVGPLAGDS